MPIPAKNLSQLDRGSPAEKLDEQINVAVTSGDKARAQMIYKLHRIKPTEMGRLGLIEVMNRIEYGWPVAGADELRALAEVKKVGGDPVAILRAAIPSLSAAQALNPEKR